MNASPGSIPAQSLFSTLAQALQSELKQISSAQREIRLFSGVFVGAFAGNYYYRFEIPEEVLLRNTERATFTFGQLKPISVPGNIITVENQFLTVALPQDFGSSLPEVRCSWNFEEHQQPIIERLSKGPGGSPVAPFLFNPADPNNRHAVSFEAQSVSNTPPEQLEALKKILQNKVTLVWGPILSGKSHVLALTAAYYLKAGKKVLFVTSFNDEVDEGLMKAVELGQQLGLDMAKLAARVDLPSLVSSEAIAAYSFEHQLETARAEKRKTFQERVTLLQTYWKVKVKHILHEDFYSRVQELRDKLNEARKQSEQVNKEIAQSTEVLNRIQSASVLERMKKGFSREDLAVAQKQLSDKQQTLKRLQSIQQTLSSEIGKVELNNPMSGEETKEFNLAMKRLEELGGVDQVTKSVEEFTAVDEASLLRSKQFIATSVATALLDPSIRNQQFDLVIVAEAQGVNLPTLAALATFAKEKLVVAGDPFQVEPESFTNSEAAQQWLQRDIFLHVAQTDELNRLFDWSQKNSQWCVFLSSHFAMTPKLSVFVGSVLFDDKVNVFVSPKAKGKIYFIDTSDLKSRCRQYVGRKRILPFNDLQSRKMVECVKHALMEPDRGATDVGVIVPFTGPTLHSKLQLRLNGIKNVEVGTPQSFRGRKKAIIFDATMAGVDYTIRSIDDRKIGEHKIVRLFNTVFSSVAEDLYVLADMSHFRTLYKDRLFTRILMLLQAQADHQQPTFGAAVKKFDDLDWDKRMKILSLGQKQKVVPTADAAQKQDPHKPDFELQMKMKLLASKQAAAQATGVRNFEREIFHAAQRVLALRTDTNLVSEFVGGDLLFRNSFATEQAVGRLPIDGCENEKNFKDIMERWNLLIYEMSGGSKADLAYFTTKGSETRVRQDILHLKAFYSSDAQAVITEGKQKIAADVSKIFQELLGKPQPGNPAEWSTAYINFLARLETYLNWISEQVRK